MAGHRIASPTRWSSRLADTLVVDEAAFGEGGSVEELQQPPRVVTAQKLTLLRDALRKLAAELAADDAFRDPDRVGKLLTSHRLTADAFVDAYAQRAIPAQ